MHRIHKMWHPFRMLIWLVLAAALSPGSFGNALAQAGSQEVQPPSISSAPQIPEGLGAGPATEQAAAPMLQRRTYLPVVRDTSSTARQVIAAIDTEREQAGCAPLHVDGQLMQAAQTHSDDMARHDFLSHEGSDGSLPADRVAGAGYSMSYIGETILHEPGDDAEHAVSRWMESEAHRAILLRCTTQDIGAGVSLPYWTVVVANHF
jgi:uncharacterized protein YkwD